MGIYRGGDIARGLWALFRYSPRQGGQWHFRYRDHCSFPRWPYASFRNWNENHERAEEEPAGGA